MTKFTRNARNVPVHWSDTVTVCGFILAILAFFLAIYCNSSVVGSRKRESSVEKQIEESNRRRRRLTSKQLPANLDLLLLRDFVFFIYLSIFMFVVTMSSV